VIEWSYIINSALWSIAGLMIGYLLGRLERNVEHMERDVEQIKRKVCADDDQP